MAKSRCHAVFGNTLVMGNQSSPSKSCKCLGGGGKFALEFFK